MFARLTSLPLAVALIMAFFASALVVDEGQADSSVKVTKTVRWTLKKAPAVTDSGDINTWAGARAKDKHIDEFNPGADHLRWGLTQASGEVTTNEIAGGDGHPFANGIATASADAPVTEGNDTHIWSRITNDVYNTRADPEEHGRQDVYATSRGRVRVKSGEMTRLEVQEPGKKVVTKPIFKRETEANQSAEASGIATYKDPITLVLLTSAGDTVAVEELLHFSVTAHRNATMAWDDTVGIVLDTPLDGSAVTVNGSFPSAWITASPGPFSASLAGGQFSTSGWMTGMPWMLTYQGSDIVRAQLSAVPAPSFEVEYQVPAAVLDDETSYIEELLIDGEAEAEESAAPSVLVIDGTIERYCEAPVSVQDTQTAFGDNLLGLPDLASGSELNSACAFFADDTLYLFLAGNLESNFNKLEIFFDGIGGGQNRLRGNNPNVDFGGLNRMGDDGSGNGLRFDAGFGADRWLGLQGGDSGGGYRLHASFATLPSGGGGGGGYLGQRGAGGDGALSGGVNPYGIRATIDNSNVAGMGGGCGASAPGDVETGIEIAVPLVALGSPTGCVKIAVFVNGVSHDFVSNQVLGPLPPGTCNLGEPRFVDFAAIPDNQYFEICLPAPLAVEAPPLSSGPRLQAWPNPFHHEVQLRLEGPAGRMTRVDVFDVSGRKVKSFAAGTLGTGSLAWNGRGDDGRMVPAGIYMVRARTESSQHTLLLLRTR